MIFWIEIHSSSIYIIHIIYTICVSVLFLLQIYAYDRIAMLVHCVRLNRASSFRFSCDLTLVSGCGCVCVCYCIIATASFHHSFRVDYNIYSSVVICFHYSLRHCRWSGCLRYHDESLSINFTIYLVICLRVFLFVLSTLPKVISFNVICRV